MKNTLSEKVVVIENEKNLIDGEDFNFKSLEINFNIKELQSDVYTFSLFNSAGDSISFGLNNTEKYFFSDRSKAGDLSFSDKFGSSKTIAPLYKELDELLVQIIIDKTSMEIFYNSGRYVMTEIFFPSQPLHGFSIKSSHKEFEIEDFIVKQLEF